MQCLFAGIQESFGARCILARGPRAVRHRQCKREAEDRKTADTKGNRRRGGGRGPTGGGPTPDGSTGAEAGRWNDETPAPIERRLYNKPTPRVVAPATYLLTTINPRQRQRDDDLRSLRARTARRFLQRGTERSKTELKKMRGVRGR